MPTIIITIIIIIIITIITIIIITIIIITIIIISSSSDSDPLTAQLLNRTILKILSVIPTAIIDVTMDNRYEYPGIYKVTVAVSDACRQRCHYHYEWRHHNCYHMESLSARMIINVS